MFYEDDKYQKDMFDIDAAARSVAGSTTDFQYDIKRAAWDILRHLE